MKKHIFLILIIFQLCLVLFHSCSTTSKLSILNFKGSSSYPVGVDSLVVLKSDSISRLLFVCYENEQKGHEIGIEAQTSLDVCDSLLQELTNFQKAEVNQISTDPKDSTSSDSLHKINLIKQLKIELLNSTQKFKIAINLIPININLKDGLAQIYMLWAKVENPQFYYENAAIILEDIVLSNKGEHLFFYKLAECYFNLEKWENAYYNYHNAENVFIATSAFTDSLFAVQAENESSEKHLLFDYLYSQAVCLAKMYKSKEARNVIVKASDIAPTDELKQLAKRFEDWLNWDNGNIHTAEIKNNILKLISDKKYGEAVSEFELLKNKLKDNGALDEIEWRISGLEFKYLNKKETACKRLLKIIFTNQKNLPTHTPLFEQYLNDCGIMHYHLGMDYFRKTDYKNAQKYFQQGASIQWNGNYKCKLELAKLKKHNPKQSLDIIEEIFANEYNLTLEENLDALKIKLNAYKKMGQQYLAEMKKTYSEIREIQKRITLK